MKNRKNYLKARKKQFKWSQLGYISKDTLCPFCGGNTLIQIYKYDAWACPHKRELNENYTKGEYFRRFIK